jgi:tRNA-binding protein
MHRKHDPNAPAAPLNSFDEFLRVDIRIGTIVEANEFPEARKPALKLTIDFGDVIGLKRSSAHLVANYRSEELIGRQMAAVVNFPPRQIGPFLSEVLTLGFPDTAGKVVLFSPDRKVPNGSRLF